MASAAVSQAPSRGRRMLAFRGTLLLVFGLVMGAMLLLAFRVPDLTTRLLSIVLSAFVIIDAAATLFEAAGVTSQRGAWALLVLKALIGLVAGVAIAMKSGPRVMTIFAWWALLTGILEGTEALAFRAQRHWRLIVAGLSVLFGLLVLGGSLRDMAVMVLAVGIYGVVAGITRLTTTGQSASPPAARPGTSKW
jgi:uncharacterized membrane protein HdeD (DUF308 family)